MAQVLVNRASAPEPGVRAGKNLYYKNIGENMKQKIWLLDVLVLIGVSLLMFLFTQQAYTTPINEVALQTATFTVNSTADAVDINPGDGVCATNSGVCTLRAAIQETNALAGMDTIIVSAGTYLLTIAGTGEDQSATGDLDITDSLILNGANASTTVIDGNAIDHVFHVRTNQAVTLTEITIQNGNAPYMDGMFDGGGGIRATNGARLTIINCNIVENNSVDRGGGIFSIGNITIANSQVSNNTSQSGGGFSSASASAIITVTNSLFAENSATGSAGGGDFYGDIVNISNTQFMSNTATGWGGGVYFSRDNSNVTLEDIILAGNISGQYGGAAIVSGDNMNFSIRNGQILNNQAGGGGGGIYYSYPNGAILDIVNSTFAGNQAKNTATTSGGAILLAGDTITMTVTDSHFTENVSAVYAGGGIANFADNSSFIINNTQFLSNTANTIGGAFWSNGDNVITAITSSTFTDNSSMQLGGAVYINGISEVNINQSAFVNNIALSGGAFASFSNGTTDWIQATIRNSTFSGNQAYSSGGAIYGFGTMMDLNLRNVTVAYNVADLTNADAGYGGGFALENGASMRIGNSLIAKNIDRSDVAPDCYNPNTQISQGANLIGNATGCNWSAAPDDLIGTAISPIDPILEPLTGQLPYHPLGIGSPAIDTGSVAPITPDPNLWPGCSPIDQIGTVRPLDGDGNGTAVCDIGAVEAPERIISTVEPMLGATITYTDTQGNPTIITVPVGAVTDTTTLVFTPETSVVPPTNSSSFANHAFTLQAFRSGSQLPGFVFEQPVTVTIHYGDEDVVGIDENTLELLFWDGNAWDDEGILLIIRDAVNNQLTVTISHLSKFAMFGVGYDQIYLPMIIKP